MNQDHYNYEQRSFYGQLQAFRGWLQKRNYAKDTVRPLVNYAGCFLCWLEQQALTVQAVRYSHLLDFIDYYQQQDSTNLLNRKLAAIRQYYLWLAQEEEVTHNPATGLYLKGRLSTVPRDLLDQAALDQLYDHYQVTDERTERNKVILGLLIYQGLTNEELHQLTPEDVHLRFAQLSTPKGCQTKPRVLPLQAHQILPLQHYLGQTRPRMLTRLFTQPASQAGRRPKQINHEQLHRQLFFSSNGSEKIKSSIHFLIQTLQQTNPAVKSAAQIRQSVIACWLKVNDVGKVQYLAGHRWVSSTERYLAYHLEDLQEALKLHHPLR